MRGLCSVLILAASTATSGAQTIDAARTALAAGRIAEAVRLAEPLAAAGQAEALALLGLAARDAIPPDIDTARAFLETAAANGSPTALTALGRAYQSGQLGLTPDPVRALDHYERAVAAGSVVAEVNVLGLLSGGAFGDPDWPALRSRLAELAEAGTPGAAAMLAMVLATGTGGAADADGRARRGGRCLRTRRRPCPASSGLDADPGRGRPGRDRGGSRNA
jgi:TPR repeat protein